MKNKFFLILSAICFIITCAIGLSACGVHEHVFNEAWTTDATHHWHQCEQCNEKHDYEKHNWGDGIIIEYATPTTDGVMLFVCEVCKTTKTESITEVSVSTIYNVSYVLNGGTNHVENPINYTGDTEDIILKAPTRIGYEFLGWYTDGLYGVNEENKVEKITKETKKDLVLNAKWRGLWYFNGPQPQLTNYANSLSVIDILPEINDSFGNYSSDTFYNLNLREGNRTYIFHEGVKTIDFLHNDFPYVTVILPSTIQNYYHSDYEGGPNNLYLPNIQSLFNINTGEYACLLNGVNNLYINGELVEHLVIPDNITTIKDEFFFNAGGIKSVTIPDSVVSIGKKAFSGMLDLEAIYVGSNITTVKDFDLSKKVDLYFNDLDTFYSLIALKDSNSGIDWFDGKVFINNQQLTTIVLDGEATNFAGLEGIQNIIFKEGVTKLGTTPIFTGYMVLPKSITEVPKTVIESYNDENDYYYFMGTKAEFESKNISMYRGANLWYYSETKPTSNGKYWKFAEDSVTPEEWTCSYSIPTSTLQFVNPENENLIHSISVTNIYNGETKLYTTRYETLDSFKVYILEDDGDRIEIAKYSKSLYPAGQLEFYKNIIGYTNENGEWVYGEEGGNNLTLVAEYYDQTN